MFSSCIIDLPAIKSNYKQIRSLIQPSCMILGVVKANGYGHGAVMVSKALVQAGSDYLGVAMTEEAVEIRDAGIKTPILVFGRLPEEDFNRALLYELDITIFDIDCARALNKAAKKAKKKARIHIKFDTGLGRLGITSDDDYISFINELMDLENLEIFGLYSHFSVADSDPEYTKECFEKFLTVTNKVIEKIGYKPVMHICNSSAALLYPEMRLDMVRLGLSLYGLHASDMVREKSGIELKEAMSLTSRVVQCRKVANKSYVGYGNRYTASKGEIICNIPLGYADGIFRQLSGNVEVLIHGYRCRSAGALSMDSMNVSCPEIFKCGSEAVVIGSQGNDRITIDEIAKKAGTISYEIITSIGKRVKREYVL